MTGEFTTRRRYSQPYVSDSPTSGPQLRYFRKAEAIYSWRTVRSPEDLKGRDFQSNFGIKAPKTKGSLESIIRDRYRFMNELDQVAASAVRPTSGRKVSLTTDTGHPFASMKYSSIQVGYYRRSKGSEAKTIAVFPVGCAIAPDSVRDLIPSTAFPSETIRSQYGMPTTSALQQRINAAFHSMNPIKAEAQVGELLLSLLRGDVPRLMRNIHDGIVSLSRRDWRSTAKNVGSEHLNQQFGWMPLIRDIENAIKVLTTIDAMIYGSSTRRSRTIKYSTFHAEYAGGDRVMTRYSDGSYLSSSDSSTLQPMVISDLSYDVRLSARLIPIARPGLGANTFIDQVEEVLRKLGAWYPALGWDLLPYSWLIDWATSLGTAINNAGYYGNNPGQVSIDYAWATSCYRALSRIEFKKSRAVSGLVTRTALFPGKELSITKIRHGATPFGMGLDLKGLSSWQISILVALGAVKAL